MIKTDSDDGEDNTAFVAEKGDGPISRWTFKIEEIIEPGLWCDFVIGIIDVKNDLKHHVSNKYFCSCPNGQGFIAGYGKLSYYYCEYGIRCNNGDIIEMELNMDERCLKYIINGKDYGVAFDVPRGNYRAAVYLYKTGNKLRIL